MSLTPSEIETAVELGHTLACCPPDLLPLARQRAEGYAVMFGKRRPLGAERTAAVDFLLHLVRETEARCVNQRAGAYGRVRRVLRPLLDRRRPAAEIEAAAVDAARVGHAMGVHVFADVGAISDDEAREIARDEMLAAIYQARRRARVG